MFVKIPPPVDLLLDDAEQESLWPDGIRKHSRVARQRRLRKDLYADFTAIFDRVVDPTQELGCAIRSGLVSAGDVACLYDRLTEFLRLDPDHARIILYLPLELLPDLKSEIYHTGALADAARGFADAFLESWRALLGESDYRANFVDGDILPLEISDNITLPHVRKAAHLIPEMVRKGLLSTTEILDIAAQTNDDVLVYSILDALPVLTDLGLFSDGDWRAVLDSVRSDLGKFAAAQYWTIRPGLPSSLAQAARGIPDAARGADLIFQMIACLKTDLERIWNECEQKKIASAPASRVAWLRMERKGNCIEEYAEMIARALEREKVAWDDIGRLIRDTTDDTKSVLGIIAARKAVERFAGRYKALAVRALNFFHQIFCELWPKYSPAAKDQIFIAWSHWCAMGLMDKCELLRFGLAIPRLDSFSTEHWLIDDDLREVGPLLETVYQRQEVMEVLYPVFVFYGSRIKGYPLHSGSDLDLAVFVRPEVPENKRSMLKGLFADIASHPKIKGKILEFWLERADGRLKLRDMPTAGTMMADNSWLHVLWYGAWYGEQESIAELYRMFLPNYIYSAGQIIDGREAKSVWLRMMEMEIIQYRLLHKGYFRYFPPKSGLQTEHSWTIDSQSAFWDSGFRRVATKLFIARVFLPYLTKE